MYFALPEKSSTFYLHGLDIGWQESLCILHYQESHQLFIYMVLILDGKSPRVFCITKTVIHHAVYQVVVVVKIGALRPLGNITNRHRMQLVVKNALKVDSGIWHQGKSPKGQAIMASVALVKFKSSCSKISFYP